MKLIVAIIHDDDVNNTLDNLREQGHFVTKLSSTGGFLRTGNTTLLIGVEDEQVEGVLKSFENTCRSRRQLMPVCAPYGTAQGGFIPKPIEVVMGGATVFVLDVEQFKKF